MQSEPPGLQTDLQNGERAMNLFDPDQKLGVSNVCPKDHFWPAACPVRKPGISAYENAMRYMNRRFDEAAPQRESFWSILSLSC